MMDTTELVLTANIAIFAVAILLAMISITLARENKALKEQLNKH